MFTLEGTIALISFQTASRSAATCLRNWLTPLFNTEKWLYNPGTSLALFSRALNIYSSHLICKNKTCKTHLPLSRHHLAIWFQSCRKSRDADLETHFSSVHYLVEISNFKLFPLPFVTKSVLSFIQLGSSEEKKN